MRDRRLFAHLAVGSAQHRDGETTMTKYFAWGAMLLVGLLLGGCYTDFGPVVVEPERPAAATLATHIQAGDRIKLTVYGEDNLTGFYDVDPAGRVSLPLVGQIGAAGRTVSELERDIMGRYRGAYLQDPKVTVDIVEFRPFYIMGEVTNPGQFAYRSGLNVLTAISTAGGLTYRASRSAVLIQHPGENVWHQYAPTSTVLIAPGDLIRIPERYF
jgi:protein involved in polysaccharide export with SLBB domain